MSGARAPAVLETGRLQLREMHPGDVDALLRVLGDPEAMRFYPAPFTRHQVEEWIEWNRTNYAEYGYGLWALVLKTSGEVVGDCGLTWQRVAYSASRELEAGWHVRRDLWDQGLATEASTSVRDYARDVLRRSRLVSIVTEHNLASRAVARKLGMAFERVDSLDGRDRLIFSMTL